MEITSSEGSHIPVASTCRQPPRVDPPGRDFIPPVFGDAWARAASSASSRVA